ncbi:MAG: nicotinamide-nucleotide amidohydrolase family protein [bacterium]|nr:nicotinamide-nucleotide amidohydrolase family protein [bacterium]
MEARLEFQVGEALKARGWTISAAESCTGGLVMHRLTDIPGSSAYVIGGVVSYANAVKRDLLKVKQETLDTQGAVSAETAQQMVIGALNLFGTDAAVAITGIAGPGGGTPAKPVGLTYIAAALKGAPPVVERHVWSGDREAVKAASAEAALRLILSLLQTA